MRLKSTLSILFALIVLSSQVLAQSNITIYTSYWEHRADLFKRLPNKDGEICFLGDSITDGCEWAELTGDPRCTNRGISGDTAWGVLRRLKEVYEGKPAKVFLMIGTNDLSRGKTVSEVRDKIVEIIDILKRETPDTEIYIESVLPTIDTIAREYKNGPINELNKELVKLAGEKQITWVDLRDLFRDDSGQLKKELTKDGLHLNGEAYYLWLSAIKKYL